jgi:hypothetical protein
MKFAPLARRRRGWWWIVPTVPVLLLASCTHVSPTKPPVVVATPPPVASTGPVDGGMLLHRVGVQLVQADGNAFDFRGAVACCNTEPGEPNPKWPLASEPWLDFMKTEGNVNMIHVRPGPWRAIMGTESEIEWADEGGGYLEVAGKADLSQFNPKFWRAIDTLLSSAARRGIWVEVDLIDGWGIKHCGMGDIPDYHPWSAANNLQSENHCQPKVDIVQEAWIRKAVEIAGRHGNVVFETSNEGGLVRGWNVAWEETIISIVKGEEAALGYPHHLISSNAERDVPSADWAEWHTAGQPSPPGQKISGMNETNPEPPLSGAVMAANYCTARGQGTYYWLWRHGMSLAEWKKALNAMRAGCGGGGTPAPVGCRHPDFDSSGWKTVCAAGQAEGGKDCDITATLTPDHLNELGAALGRVKAKQPGLFADRCLVGGGTPAGDNPAHAAERWAVFDATVASIADELRAGGVCAWQQGRVEIHTLRSDGFWGQLHPISTGNGCLTGNPYVGSWKEP